MSVFSFAKAFPSETGNILTLISEILPQISGAKIRSQKIANLIWERVTVIVELLHRMTDNFVEPSNAQNNPETHRQLLMKYLQYCGYMTNLETLPSIFVDPTQDESASPDEFNRFILEDLENDLHMLRDKIEKDN